VRSATATSKSTQTASNRSQLRRDAESDSRQTETMARGSVTSVTHTNARMTTEMPRASNRGSNRTRIRSVLVDPTKSTLPHRRTRVMALTMGLTSRWHDGFDDSV
jgi:hypothetical protein